MNPHTETHCTIRKLVWAQNPIFRFILKKAAVIHRETELFEFFQDLNNYKCKQKYMLFNIKIVRPNLFHFNWFYAAFLLHHTSETWLRQHKTNTPFSCLGFSLNVPACCEELWSAQCGEEDSDKWPRQHKRRALEAGAIHEERKKLFLSGLWKLLLFKKKKKKMRI